MKVEKGTVEMEAAGIETSSKNRNNSYSWDEYRKLYTKSMMEIYIYLFFCGKKSKLLHQCTY